jgi:regulator of replication initiation timing
MEKPKLRGMLESLHGLKEYLHGLDAENERLTAECEGLKAWLAREDERNVRLSKRLGRIADALGCKFDDIESCIAVEALKKD